MADVISQIEDLFETKGSEEYGEKVTMREHMLLTAQTAVSAGASDELIAACLLHDVGHLLEDPDDQYGKHTHDEIGADWVSERFPPAVSEPVRGHVDAKRYLCGVNPDYYHRLSPASQYTLGKQGGPMDAAEIDEFEQLPYFADAVQLRRWEDEYAKTNETDVPDFDNFRPVLERVLR